MSLRLSMLMLGLRYGVRPLIGMTTSPATARKGLDTLTRLFTRPARGTRIDDIRLGHLRARKILCTQPIEGAALLYFHGGGYVTGSPLSHTPMVSRLGALSRVTAYIPQYRLAPEAPFPAAFEDAQTAWAALRETGLAADRILIGGDSAGGGLALALLADLVRRGERPAGAFAFSPWTDLTLTGQSLTENAQRDALLPVRRIRDLTDMVLQGAEPGDARISPLFADFAGAPPVYVQVSDSEILRDDTLRLSDRLAGQGVDVQVDRWPDAPHVWQMMDGWVPEARDGLERTAAFMRDCLMTPSRQSGS